MGRRSRGRESKRGKDVRVPVFGDSDRDRLLARMWPTMMERTVDCGYERTVEDQIRFLDSQLGLDVTYRGFKEGILFVEWDNDPGYPGSCVPGFMIPFQMDAEHLNDVYQGLQAQGRSGEMLVVSDCLDWLEIEGNGRGLPLRCRCGGCRPVAGGFYVKAVARQQEEEGGYDDGVV